MAAFVMHSRPRLALVGAAPTGPEDGRICALLERAAAAFGYRETGDPFGGAEPERPPLRVGLGSSLAGGFLRDLIAAVRADPDAPPLSFRDGSPDDLIEAASYGGVDIAFVPGDHDWWRLRHEELWREPLMLLAPDDHPLIRRAEVSPWALRRERLLIAGGPAELDDQRELLTRALGARPSDIVAMDVERGTLPHLVSLGLGLAVTTPSALGGGHPGLAVRPLAAPARPVPFHAVWRAANCDGGLAGVLEMARELATDWPGRAPGPSEGTGPCPMS